MRLALVLLIFVATSESTNSVDEPAGYEQNIIFKFYRNNAVVFESKSSADDLAKVCKPTEPWLILVPGWNDNCSAHTEWMPKLIEQFTKHRGGCIVCMDYFVYSNDASLMGYVNLTTHFDGISHVLTNKLRQFERQNFRPDRGYMFGFSFGSRLAINSGRDFGGRLEGIDACEPAGPLFYPNPSMQARGSARLAARNVQIIHTSVDLGTFERDGHQNWLMGACGITQPAVPPVNGTRTFAQMMSERIPFYVPLLRENHSMCPWFYISAFENVFASVNMPCCPATSRDEFARDYRMGYMQSNKGQIQGKTLYARTYKNSPYNLPSS